MGTCQGAATELAKRSVQVAGCFRLAEAAPNRECSDNLLRPGEGRSHRVRIVTTIDWGLPDSTHRMREPPQGPACPLPVCLYQPNKARATRRRCRRLRPLGRCCADLSGNEQWRLQRRLSARDNNRCRGWYFAPERDAREYSSRCAEARGDIQ